jgi:uridine phosphorylase
MEEPRFTADMYMRHYAAQRGITIEEIGVAPVVVLSGAPGVVRSMAELVGAEFRPAWPWSKRRPFFTGSVGQRRVSFAQVGIGAPATVAEMEEMIVCGARTFITLGWAGSLQPSLSIGSLLIPTACVTDDGTSPHYTLPGSGAPVPDSGLVDILQDAAAAEGLPVQLGPHWTTDAPFRELPSVISVHRANGVLGVDMESAAMFALGQFRDVAVANLLVISDDVWREWRSASYTDMIRVANQDAQRVVLRALRRL